MDIYNKIDLKHFEESSSEPKHILLRSDELSKFYTEVFNIIYTNVLILEKNTISIIMSYFEDNPIKLFFNKNMPSIYDFAGIFSGTYITNFFSSCDEGYGPYEVDFLNIKNDIGEELYNEKKLMHISYSKHVKKLWNENDGTLYDYGQLCSKISTCNCDNDIQDCCRTKLKNNNTIDDLSKYLPRFNKISNNRFSKTLTQIRKGKDIIKGTYYDDIFSLFPEDYFFVCISKKSKNSVVHFITKLSEYEYLSIMNELKEVNTLFDYDIFERNFYGETQ